MVIDVALLGVGRWGRHILRDLRELGCRVTVVARSKATRARANEGGADAIVGSIDELPDIAGAVVATPTATHAEVVAELLDRGLRVFVEKPLTADVESARQLAEAGADRVFVMDKWRYHPGVEELARIARSGELGEAVGLRGTRLSWGHQYRDVDGLWILVPHELAIALEVLGHIPPARHAVCEWTGDIATGLVGVLGDTPWLVLEASVTAPARRRELRLLCEGGTAWLSDAYSPHVAVARADGIGDEPELRSISTEMPLLRELRAFIDHLNGGPPPRSSVAEGLEVVERLADLRELAGAGDGLFADAKRS